MGLMGLEGNRNAAENGVFGSDSSEFQLGSKNKYKRMQSEVSEEDGPLTKENRDTKKYVFACAIFASLNSVLLGYGWYFFHLFNATTFFVICYVFCLICLIL